MAEVSAPIPLYRSVSNVLFNIDMHPKILCGEEANVLHRSQRQGVARFSDVLKK